jgi:hypothetical protein
MRYLPITSTPLAASPACVVFVRFNAGGPTEIQPLAPFGALERLLAQCIFVPQGFQHDDVEHLLSWHARQRYFDLAFCDCDSAAATLASIQGPDLP